MARRHRRTPPPSLRRKLLLAVNAVLVVGLALLLTVDYRKGFDRRLADQRMRLQDEARALAELAGRTRRPERLVQRLHESAAAQAGRICLVQTSDGRLVQVPETPDLAEPIRRGAAEPGQRVQAAGKEWLVSRARVGPTVAWAAETVSGARRAVRQDLAYRLGGLALIGLAVAAVISLLLVRWVSRPLERLVGTVRRIGRGELGVIAPRSGTAEFDQLADQITRLSRKLAMAESERRRQLEKARRIQSQLSGRWDAAPGLTLAHLYQPMDGVAGDYYDLLTLKDATSVMCIADVSGHGVPAAMEASVLKTLLLASLKRRTDLGAVMREINRFFHATSLPEDFATMTLVRWMPTRRQLAFASAGHETGYLVRDGRPLALESTGTLLGIAAEGDWEMLLYDAVPGERVVLLTDGVVEAQNGDGEQFGRRRVRACVAETADKPPAEVALAFERRLREHRGRRPRGDDITVLVADLAETDDSAASAVRQAILTE